MQLYELFLIAVSLSMDALAVSIAKGLTMEKVRARDAALVGAWFGFFQFLMPLIGAFLGAHFLQQIKAVDHWIAFGILAFVGGNMIREALQKGGEETRDTGKETAGKDTEKIKNELRPSVMFPLAIATSIDALAVGITFGLLGVRIVSSSVFIGCVTFCISFGGVYAGRFLGKKVQKGAAVAGGVVLICIGVKILLEHLGVIAW